MLSGVLIWIGFFMSIPDFQTLMLPVLKLSSHGETQIGEAVQKLADEFRLSQDEKAELLPSGRQTTFANRVHWAKSYLNKAGLVALTKRGHFQITDLGSSVLAEKPIRIDIRYLSRFPEFQSFRADRKGNINSEALPPADLTPDETMRRARDQIELELGSELISRILSSSPEFFERLIVQLLLSMGYGGSLEDAGRALGRSGDGGVDGVIAEDALGLDRIYVQAKRYGALSNVGPGEIRDFFGALDQFKAGKGLFVTTSSFTASAVKTAEGLSKRIVLVDGTQLTKLMIRFGVGCRIEETLHVKKIDQEFFEA
jgi:restriction system protein